MTRYDLFLFLHIMCAVLWIGSGTLLLILGVMTERAADDEGFAKLFGWTSALGNRLFVPASVGVLVLGFALVGEGPWSLDQLWLVLALAGYAATFATGVLVAKPSSDRVAALVARDGRMGPEALAIARRMLLIGRVDLIVLWLVIFDMAVKPTGDDVGVLAFMALAVAAGVAWVVALVRAQERIAAA